MKSEKGITMGSLVIYITIFFAISSIIAVITSYYYQNIMELDSSAASAVEYDKLNVYLLQEVKKAGNDILGIEKVGESPDEEGYARSVTFTSGNSYYRAGNNIYMNQIRLCENVTLLEFEIIMQNNEKILKTTVQFDGGDILETNYVLALEKDYDITQNQDSEFSSGSNNGIQTYTVSFYDEDGTLLDIVTVTQGQTATYSGELVKPSDEYYTYTHDSWTTTIGDSSTKVDLSNVTSNMTVYASYAKKSITYTVTFYNEDGTEVLYSAEVTKGSTAVYSGPDLTKTGYTFSTWVTSVGGDTVAVLENVTNDMKVYATYIENAICFAPGTKVLTIFGLIDIEKIKPGMKVYSRNMVTEKIEIKDVLQTFKNYVDYNMCKVYTKKDVIECTDGHEFFVKNKGWIDAIELNEGDILLNNDNEEVLVEKIEVIRVEENELNVVYNFEVEDNHNYYVGSDAVLVHNADSCAGHV